MKKKIRDNSARKGKSVARIHKRDIQVLADFWNNLSHYAAELPCSENMTLDHMLFWRSAEFGRYGIEQLVDLKLLTLRVVAMFDEHLTLPLKTAEDVSKNRDKVA